LLGNGVIKCGRNINKLTTRTRIRNSYNLEQNWRHGNGKPIGTA
jgi:hypothetical protein